MDNGGMGRISGLDFELTDGTFELRHGNGFYAELDPSADGTLYTRCGIWYIRASGGSNNRIYIPRGLEASGVRIKLCGAELSMPGINAVDISLRISGGRLYAGTLRARCINAELGLGYASMTAAPGVSAFFECGAGSMKTILAGSAADYSIRCEHGVGTVTAGGRRLRRHDVLGSGEKEVFARCGMGSMELDFSESKELLHKI